MTHHDLISKMRGRVAMCRRLAASTTDKKTAEILRDMADEGERDIERLESEEAEAEATGVRLHLDQPMPPAD